MGLFKWMTLVPDCGFFYAKRFINCTVTESTVQLRSCSVTDNKNWEVVLFQGFFFFFLIFNLLCFYLLPSIWVESLVISGTIATIIYLYTSAYLYSHLLLSVFLLPLLSFWCSISSSFCCSFNHMIFIIRRRYNTQNNHRDILVSTQPQF